MGQMDTMDIKRFIGITLKENGKQMRESTASYFIQQTGSSMSNIINELDKLVSYTYGRDEITKEDIDAICCVQIVSHIFQMIDYAATGNITSALKLYNDLLELRESPMSVLYLLTRHFNMLLQVKMLEGLQKSDIASKLKIPPFAAGKYPPTPPFWPIRVCFPSVLFCENSIFFIVAYSVCLSELKSAHSHLSLY